MSTVNARRKSLAWRMVAAALAMPAAVTAFADEPPPGWSGKGQLGYLMSRGNSVADTANAMLDLLLVRQDWKHELLLDGLYGKSAGIVSAERWDARLQSNYAINKQLYTFGALNYQNDKFSGFQYQASVSAGIGYKFINSDATQLDVQIGAGYRALRPEQLIKDANGAVIARILQPSESEAVGTAAVDFEHVFNPNTKVTDKLFIESGASNTSIKNNLALEVKIARKLALAAGYGIIDNTQPPAGLKRVDSTVTLNLVYAFPEPK